MGVNGIWQLNATVLVILIVANMALTLVGEALWIIVGVLSLAGAMFLSFRQGANLGHGACGVSATIDGARRAGDQVYAQLDRKYLSQAWSVSTGIRGLLASALIPYLAGGVYIVLTLASQGARPMETPVTLARVAAWLLSLPYWPIIMHWHEDFVVLTPAIAAMLLVSPFALPACTFAGYMQGPRRWAQTEIAMKEGRRRAKARARVGKTMAPKQQKPEI